MQYQFGDVYYIHPADPSRGIYAGNGTLRAGRPGVIVSSSVGMNGYQIMVVFCTTKYKPESDCIFTTTIRGKTSAVLCNEIQTIDISQIGDFITQLSPSDSAKLARCLYNSIGDGTGNAARAQIAEIRRILNPIPRRTVVDRPHPSPYYAYPKTSAPTVQRPIDNGENEDDEYDE